MIVLPGFLLDRPDLVWSCPIIREHGRRQEEHEFDSVHASRTTGDWEPEHKQPAGEELPPAEQEPVMTGTGNDEGGRRAKPAGALNRYAGLRARWQKASMVLCAFPAAADDPAFVKLSDVHE